MVILFHKYLDECLKRQDTSISMFKVEDDTESIDAKMLISAKLLERMVGEDVKSKENIKWEENIKSEIRRLDQC